MTGEDMLYHSGTIVMGHEAAGSSDSDGCDRPELFFLFPFSHCLPSSCRVRGEGGEFYGRYVCSRLQAVVIVIGSALPGTKKVPPEHVDVG